LATFAQSSFSSGVVALCVCLSASFEVQGILIRLRFLERPYVANSTELHRFLQRTNRLAPLGQCRSMGQFVRQSETPLQASISNSALSPLRHRVSSSRHRARPMPGTGKGVESSALTRQRVVAAVGWLNSAAWAWRHQRRRARPMTPEPSAASCNLCEAVMDRRATSATTAPSLLLRRGKRPAVTGPRRGICVPLGQTDVTLPPFSIN
jgi:hypothetical protein